MGKLATHLPGPGICKCGHKQGDHRNWSVTSCIDLTCPCMQYEETMEAVKSRCARCKRDIVLVPMEDEEGPRDWVDYEIWYNDDEGHVCCEGTDFTHLPHPDDVARMMRELQQIEVITR